MDFTTTDKNDTNHNSIELLAEHLIDQIKAGEVIERPANLLKEVLENSVDAGSTQIDIHIVDSGLELISVRDNGKGMNFNELPYAFCRHATSKIKRFEDIYKLSSYGFRGEALASISAICRLTCTSMPSAHNQEGAKMVIHAAETISHQPYQATTSGTQLFIKDLFYNTPARLKFIKSKSSEKSALKRIILSFILTHPEIAFTIKWDDQDKKIYPSGEQAQINRIGELFSEKGATNDIFSFNANYENHYINAYFGHKATKGNSYKKHFLFVNDRLFTDRQIHQSIQRSMERLYPDGGSGHYVVFIKAPSDLIDVNVHPSKTQVKFFKLAVITALLSSEIKKLAKELDITPLNFNKDHSIPNQAMPSNHTENFNHGGFNFNEFQSRTSLENADTKSHTSQPNFWNDQSRLSNHNSLIGPLSIIYNKNGQAYLLYKESLFKTIESYFKDSPIIEDKDYTSFLIAQNIKEVEIDQSAIKSLQKQGLNIERLENGMLVLRAHHRIYDGLPISDYLEVKFNELKSYSNTRVEFSDTLIERINSNYFLSQNKNKFLRPINKDLLTEIFS